MNTKLNIAAEEYLIVFSYAQLNVLEEKKQIHIKLKYKLWPQSKINTFFTVRIIKFVTTLIDQLDSHLNGIYI